MSITVTRDPNSFFISFRLDSGLKGSISACKSRSGDVPPDHHSSCFDRRDRGTLAVADFGVPSLQPNDWIVARREECKAQRGESAEIFLKNPDDYAAYLQTDAKLMSRPLI